MGGTGGSRVSIIIASISANPLRQAPSPCQRPAAKSAVHAACALCVVLWRSGLHLSVSSLCVLLQLQPHCMTRCRSGEAAGSVQSTSGDGRRWQPSAVSCLCAALHHRANALPRAEHQPALGPGRPTFSGVWPRTHHTTSEACTAVLAIMGTRSLCTDKHTGTWMRRQGQRTVEAQVGHPLPRRNQDPGLLLTVITVPSAARAIRVVAVALLLRVGRVARVVLVRSRLVSCRHCARRPRGEEERARWRRRRG